MGQGCLSLSGLPGWCHLRIRVLAGRLRPPVDCSNLSAMNPYRELVETYDRLFREGKRLPHGGFRASVTTQPRPGAPVALIYSPHPDDECIVGALALRLLRECGWRVANVAVTQGSNKARQEERLKELRGACEYMGFGLVQTATGGLERVNPRTRHEDAAHWGAMVGVIESTLREYRPAAIFFPHENDWNSTHVGVHYLVMDALARIGSSQDIVLVETEYWGQMTAPNLMVESGPGDVTDMVGGVSFHAGEVRRNPFHLLLPAWMQDNVRRGSELVGGQGKAAPDFGFATLYRVRGWVEGRRVDASGLALALGVRDNPERIRELVPAGESSPR